MLQKLYVDNYKCLVNFELPVQELSLLLGRSGAGKTSVLDVMFALRRLLDGSARVTDADVFPTRTLTRWQERALQTIEITVLLANELFQYRLEIERDRTTRRARIMLEELTRSGKNLFKYDMGSVTLYRPDFSPGPQYTVDWSESALARVAPREKYVHLTHFLDFMRKITVCSFYPPSFHTELKSEDPILKRDSHNFADWYRHVLQDRPDLMHGFIEELRNIVDNLHGIRLKQVGAETRELVIEFNTGNDRPYELRFDEISDGQRALIALYALIHMTADQGYTFFIDEPDNYVALREIQPWLMATEDACGNTVSQVVLTSHHPEVIDFLGCERSCILQRESSGVVTVRAPDVELLQPGLKFSELIARGWEA